METSRKLLTAKRKEEIEETAQMVLSEYFPVDELIRPEIIARGEDIKYHLNNYNHDYKGLIEYKDSVFRIFIDTSLGKNLDAPVLRYSFAHELGHYFIDEHRIELMNKGILPQVNGDPMLSENIFEKEAEFFASCLLMPRDRFIRDVSEHPFSTWLVHKLCKKYMVSQTAALKRYIALGPEPIAVIYNYLNGKHDRKISSNKFRHHSLNLDKDNFIPADSVAGRYCYEGNEDFKTNNLIAADVWFNPKTEEDALRVYREECLLQPNLNRIVSVVYEKVY
jgi:Zn-dependent peptidase ImmA (M78 family)